MGRLKGSCVEKGSAAPSAWGRDMGSGSSSTDHLQASKDSGVFKGIPGRKLVALICPGQEKRGFGE